MKAAKALGLLLLIVLIVAAAAWILVIASLPQTRGSVQVPVTGSLLPPGLPGSPSDPATSSRPPLGQAVTISRDAYAIPTIRAANELDGAFALGYVHAQDRLWQMDMMRRVGSGRLSEVLGSKTLPVDRFSRTLGLEEQCRSTWQTLPNETKSLLTAYANGVNHFLNTHNGTLPPEFLALAYKPEPWIETDTLLWGRLMGIWLSGDWTDELLRSALAGTLTPAEVHSLWPELGPEPDQARGATDGAGMIAPQTAATMLASVPPDFRPRSASNAWAVSGAKTASGFPMLASDPHLELEAPIQWYLARIETPERTLVGGTVPGVPFLLIGHNGSVAWGLTTAHTDTTDLVLEAPVGSDGTPADPKTARYYLSQSGPKPFIERIETIKVRFSEPVRLTVRRTGHGPIISDVLLPSQAPALAATSGQGKWLLALWAPAQDGHDETPHAYHLLNRARTLEDVDTALQSFYFPHQTVVFATKQGDIGRISPARVPLRENGPPFGPQPGWDRADKVEFMDYRNLPREINPAPGYVLNTNDHLVVADGTRLRFQTAYPGDARASRLHTLLAPRTALTPRDMADIQMDTVSPVAEDLLPILLNFSLASGGQDARDARDAYAAASVLSDRRWDYSMDRDLLQPLLAAVWLRELNSALFAEPMGDLWPSWERIDPDLIERALSKDRFWCRNAAIPPKTTDDPLSCERLKVQTLGAAMAWLTAQNPKRDLLTQGKWGDLHVAHFRHPLWQHVPVAGLIANVDIPTSGGQFTLSRGGYRLSGPDAFTHNHGAGLRAVIDFADLDESGFVIATGQSGHPLSEHYRDMTTIWRDGGLITINGRDSSGGSLVLVPH